LFDGYFFATFVLLNYSNAFLGVISDYIFGSPLNLLQSNDTQN